MRNRVARILLLVAFIALALSAASSAVEVQEQTVGLFLNEPGSFDGYTLFGPILNAPTTYLIDNEGREVHSWETGSGLSTYLLEDGSLIRSVHMSPNDRFDPGGWTGGVRHLEWDGTPVWAFGHNTADYMTHHDIEVLPNGNVLMIAWENKTSSEAIAAGRDPALLEDGELWPEKIIEVEPTGATTGNIVWEWHVWDHLIQDNDADADNFGVVADHAELIDVNYFDSNRPPGGEKDWLHANAVDYNEEFDQIVLSVRHFSELWVIDHSTTTEEAAGHTGGNSGKGGDILYRWGNPEAYGAGDAQDRKLFAQHDTRWIDPGLPGEGNIMIFNNGDGRPVEDYSSVDEIVPPVDGSGNYSRTPGQAYEPTGLTWTYAAPTPPEFYSRILSGSVRLPGGNTLINSGAQGTFFEVTPEGETVWRYVNPVTSKGVLAQGDEVVPFGANIVFRAERYAPDYVGLQGKDLTPGVMIEISDSDKDGLTDQDEFHIYGTDPLDPDTDDDGCDDGAELEPNSEAGTGGGRDPLYFWDFFDVPVGGSPRDRAVDAFDIGAVVLRFGAFVEPPPTKEEALAQGLTPPADATSYHAAYDRGGPTPGENLWNLLPPDGAINAFDIGAVVVQFGHTCA